MIRNLKKHLVVGEEAEVIVSVKLHQIELEREILRLATEADIVGKDLPFKTHERALHDVVLVGLLLEENSHSIVDHNRIEALDVQMSAKSGRIFSLVVKLTIEVQSEEVVVDLGLLILHRNAPVVGKPRIQLVVNRERRTLAHAPREIA